MNEEKENKRILSNFGKICQVPRCSGAEEQIRGFFLDWAREHGFQTRIDRVGNLLISVPPNRSGSDASPVILQGHLDMVCEKTPGSGHIFGRDPIRLKREGDWLGAVDTTLGADNGAGLALAMTLAEDRQLRHPGLELLFTVDEESGLTGAAGLEAGFVSGRVMLNLDSEDEGVFIIGCAGGRDSELELAAEYVPWPEGFQGYELGIGGLQGGHSGVDIHEERGNANVLLARTLANLKQGVPFRLADLSGGSAHNAIPRESAALLAIEKKSLGILQEALQKWVATLTAELPHEPGLKISLTERDRDGAAIFSDPFSCRVIDLLLGAPNGVMAWSKTAPGIVETSVNLATINHRDGRLKILFSQRSDNRSRLDWLDDRLAALARLAGAERRGGNGYPGWQPDPASLLLARARRIYRREFGKEPEIKVIHAGLECGLIGARNPGLEMLSLGPTIKNPHSPGEKLHVPSLDRCDKLLRALLADYAES